jgi:tetratricopeptide (TPR) repeat protein
MRIDLLRSNRCAFLLLGLFLFLAYSNSFDVPWHLDDFGNILQNKKVQVADFSSEAVGAFCEKVWGEGWLRRPLALTSLAANWYFGGRDPAGYHAVNLGIHMLSAIILYLACSRLFQTPRMDGQYSRGQVHLVSLLATFLWAANPIQTQAVTYIIQRMASMSAMFFILSIWGYLAGRQAHTWKGRLAMFTLCALGAVAAFLCKENAATLPLSLLLIEAVFYQDLRNRKSLLVFLSILAACALIGISLGAILFFGGNPLGVLTYSDRFFTAWERLLSQPRALVLYLSLLVYPVPTRLSITHDFAPSTSLLSPWTTGASLLAVTLLVFLAAWRIRRWPLLSFAILFFFTNHLIESSILSLELVFEHRNYLPSMFFFVPAAAALARGLDHFRNRSALVYGALWVFVPLLVIGLGAGTYVRNRAWASARSLWEDAMQKAPGESRPLQMLAVHHFDRVGDSATSLLLYQQALKLRKSRISDDALIYNNMAALYFARKEFARAAELWAQAVERYPAYQFTRYHLAVALMKCGRPKDALELLEQILHDRPEYFAPRNLKGMILIGRNHIAEGLAELKQCIRSGGVKRSLLINLGAAFFLAGDGTKAGMYFRQACNLAPDDPVALLWQAKLQVKHGLHQEAGLSVSRLSASGSLPAVRRWLLTGDAADFPEDDVISPEFDPPLLAILGHFRQDSRQQLSAIASGN